MEKVFIQKIFHITELILRREINDDVTLKELHTHLKKAQQMNFPHYEAEVLNTLGVLYSMQDNMAESLLYWEQALEKATDLNDIDLSLKLLSNLSSSLLEIWDLDRGTAYAQKGMQIVQANHMNTLTALYIYAANTDIEMIQGHYQQAEELYQTFWTLAQETSLLNYSRFEYAQIITAMYDVRTQLDLVAKDAVNFQADLRMLASFVDQMGRDDFTAVLLIEYLYAALILHHDDAAAAEHERKLIDLYHGKLPLPRLIQMANFLAYNQQPAWARKYAQQVLDTASREFISGPMFKRAGEIVKASSLAAD